MFEAYGESYPAALENAAKAMFSVLGKAGENERVTLTSEGHSLEELAVHTLADLLSYMDTHEIVFSRIIVKEFDGAKRTVKVEAFGEKRRPRDSVKAVTYHEMMVKEDKGGWTIRMLLDV